MIWKPTKIGERNIILEWNKLWYANLKGAKYNLVDEQQV